MPLHPPRRHHNPAALKNLDGGWVTPVTPVPGPPPAPVNANVTQIILSAGGDILLFFDRAVNIDLGSPPTSWMFNGTSPIAGGFNAGNAAEVVPGGAVGVGDTAVIGDGDPGARTPEGGYVNGATMGVSAG